MECSKCTLSPSLWPRLPLLCLLNIRQLEFHLDHNSHTCCYFVFVCLKRDLFVVVCVVGLLFLFFVAPFSLLAVFRGASAFNSDVSNWNTGAVTTMYASKCTRSLSPSLWPRRLPLWCVLLNTCIFDHSRFVGSQVSHVLFFLLFVCLKRYSFVVVCGGLAFSFRCCTLSCSVWLGTIVQFGRVQMEYGGGDGHVLQ